MNELQPFSQEDLKNRVQETIRANFCMLIPEGQWKKLVDNEIHSFFDSQSRSGEYMISPFRKLVWDELKQHLEVKVKELMAQEGFFDESSYYPKGFDSYSDVMKALITEMVPGIINGMFSGVISSASWKAHELVQEQIRNQSYNY
jgi:hypothetical protein